MNLPADFDADLWLDPLTFQFLLGHVFAHPANHLYSRLFRADGFAKPKAELMALPELQRFFQERGDLPSDTPPLPRPSLRRRIYAAMLALLPVRLFA